jgi:ABC-2 type transport system permease protein
MYVVFVDFLHIGKGIAHWPVVLLLSIVLWSFFSEVTNSGLRAIVGKSGIIRKLNFPKYTIMIANSMSALINVLINLIVIAIFMVASHTPVTWSLLLVPVCILEMLVLGLGVAFILGTLYVKVRDINFVWDVIMQGLLYGSLVMYPVTKVSKDHPSIAKLLLLNPVAQTIQDARHAISPSSMPTAYHYQEKNMWMALIPIAITLLLVIVGGWYFRKKSPYFAENI